jgi:hypothetical protein
MSLPSSLPGALWPAISLRSGAVQVDAADLLPRAKATVGRGPLPSAAVQVPPVPGEDEDAEDIIEEYILSDDDNDDVDVLECSDAAVAPPVSAQERSRCRRLGNGKGGSSKGKAWGGKACIRHAAGGQGASGTCGRKAQRRMVDGGILKKRKAEGM